MATVKVSINTQAGIIELEGEESFVGAYLDKLLPIVERSGFGTVNSGNGEKEDELLDSSDATGKNEKAQRQRARRKATPPGASCRARITKLLAAGFFKEHRTPSDIVAGLGREGYTHSLGQVGAALSDMFKANQIQRTNVDGSFKYYWDRPLP